MRYPLVLFAFLLSSCAPVSYVHKDWHVKERDYDRRDSLYVPWVACAAVRRAGAGQSLDLIGEHCLGKPVKNYFHPGIALLRTECRNRAYEVAFRYDRNDMVTGISYKLLTSPADRRGSGP